MPDQPTPRPRLAVSAALPALLACLGLAGCPGAGATSRTPPPRRPEPVRASEAPPDVDRPIPEPSARVRAAAAEDIAHFEDEGGAERVAAARRLAARGEQVLRPLLDALASAPGARTRGMAVYTLGYMDDRRVVEPVARALFDPDPDVRYDAAAALLRLGDDRGFPVLIQGLEDADPRVRARCLAILREAAGGDQGFEVDGDPLERRAAVARWKGWLERRREGGS